MFVCGVQLYFGSILSEVVRCGKDMRVFCNVGSRVAFGTNQDKHSLATDQSRNLALVKSSATLIQCLQADKMIPETKDPSIGFHFLKSA